MAFEGAAGFARGLAFADLAGEEGFGLGVVALLDERDAVEGGVELAVAAAVQAVPASGVAGAAGDRRGAAVARERGGVLDAAHVAGLGDQRGGDLVAGSEQVADGVAVRFEQRGDLGLELVDAAVEVFDVAGELADGGRRDALSESIAKRTRLRRCSTRWRSRVDDLGFGDRIDLRPIRAQPLNRLRAVQHEPTAL